MPKIDPAYELLSEREFPEYRCRGLYFRHRGTGCEVFRLESEDVENVFAFAFRTRPGDETGVAHIVEHSVLCGSERYPVKDSFLVMARRSLATFMNAFTYPDKTVYPAASAVKADYFNLMDVYGDAVFFPRLTESTFLQEAHRLELDDEGKLDIKGVVYNEMRGDYSSAESLASTASYTSLFSPGHPYSFDSGGNPEAIPELSYAGFKAFWASHYHPSNCRIFLYGNLDTGEQLRYLDERFLSRFDARTIDTEIPLQPPVLEPKRVEVPYPLAEGSDSATSIVVNWLTVPITDGASALAMETLSELLLGHDGAPLALALRESGLGEDLAPQCGIDTSFRQIVFSAGLRGARRGDEGTVEDLVVDTVAAAAARGFSEEDLDAALHSIAFANREIRRGVGAYGLRLFNRAARGWLHGSGPEATLSFEAPLAELRARMAAEPRYLESLAEELIVRGTHRSTVTVFPEAGLLESRRRAREAELASRARSMGEAERAALRARGAALAEAMAKPDSPEEIATLPRLSRSELPKSVETIRGDRVTLGGGAAGVEATVHPLFTNGIVYLDLAFPLDALARPALPWLPLATRFVTGAGIPGLRYDAVAAELARKAGGFSAILESGTPIGGAGARSYAVLRLKALEERFPAALELAVQLLARADYGDAKRVMDIFSELRNDVASALVPAGNSFAQTRAASRFSPASAIEDLWRGTSQVEFILARGKPEAEELAEELRALGASVFTRRGLKLSLTARDSAIGPAVAALEASLGELPEAPGPAGRPATADVPADGSTWDIGPAELPEAFAISAQVGFCAAACRASPIGSPGFGHETVLAHLLGTGALWEELRVKRGAYGASAWTDGLEGVACFSTYRDPRPVEALDFFREALDGAARRFGSGSPEAEAEAEEAAVGALGRDQKPLLPEEKGFLDFRRRLYGIEDRHRQEKRDAMLATGAKDIAAAAARLSAAYGASAQAVLVSGPEDVEKFRRTFPGAVTRSLSL